jgi:hypothetical protein
MSTVFCLNKMMKCLWLGNASVLISLINYYTIRYDTNLKVFFYCLDLKLEVKAQGKESHITQNGDTKDPPPPFIVEKIDEKAEHSTRWSRIKNCRWCQLISPYWGVLLALLSAILMTSYTAMIKLLDQMDSMQVIFRTFFTYPEISVPRSFFNVRFLLGRN